MPYKKSAREAFTLIELLAVVAIVGILAALLLPAIGGVREKAETAQCASNLRQIYMAFQGYANDHGGRILWSRRFNNYSDYPSGSYPDDYRQHWPTLLIKYGYLGQADIPNSYIGMESTQGWNLRKYYTVLGCPTLTRHIMEVTTTADSASGRTIPGGRSGYMNYGYNEEMTNLNTEELRLGVYANQLSDPSKTLFVGDQQWSPNTTGSDIFISSTTYFPDGIHGSPSEREQKGVGYANMCYADGHVELVDVSTIPRKGDDKYNITWLGKYKD